MIPDMTPHKVKGRGGVGLHRNPGFEQKGLKKVSKKQRHRNYILKETLKKLLKIQKDLYGHEFCCICRKPFTEDLKPTFGHLIPKGRHLPGADSLFNGEPECWPCNSGMGSREHDFRELIYKMAIKAARKREHE